MGDHYSPNYLSPGDPTEEPLCRICSRGGCMTALLWVTVLGGLLLAFLVCCHG